MTTAEYTVNTRYTSDTGGLLSAQAAQRELASTGREAAATQRMLQRANEETGISFDRLSRTAGVRPR